MTVYNGPCGCLGGAGGGSLILQMRGGDWGVDGVPGLATVSGE